MSLEFFSQCLGWSVLIHHPSNVGIAWIGMDVLQSKGVGAFLAKSSVFLFFTISFIANYSHVDKVPPKDEIGINTKFKGGRAGESIWKRHLKMSDEAINKMNEGYKVVLFPEEAAILWSDTKKLMWNRAAEVAKRRNATILVGADVGVNWKESAFSMPDEFADSLVNPTTGEVIASAHVPMPIGNWRWFPPSATHDIFKPNVVSINDKQQPYFLL